MRSVDDGIVPATTVMRDRAIVAKNKKLVGFEFEGAVDRVPTAGFGIVDVTVEIDLTDGRIKSASAESNRYARRLRSRR
jgi:hypothetical protein